MEKKLEVKNLQVSFRTQGGTVKAVRNISFDLYKGETLAIVGESGSGKSVTSKAIIGILAGNSIVEGGEILYDGQDLLKISEDDFHKIRGDKISMIFQDPLSSLNPIVRIGKQLTEAMILNGRIRQKSARKEFNGKLKLLNESLDAIDANKNNNKTQCKTFDSFCIESTKIEQVYNDAHDNAVAAKELCEEIAFLLSKKQKIDVKKSLNSILKLFKNSVNTYVVSLDDVYLGYVDRFNGFINEGKKANQNDVIALLNEVETYLGECIKKEKPNYFRLGYYLLNNPDFDYTTMPVDELDKMTKKYLDDNFMLNFIEIGSKGVQYSHDKSIENKKKLLDQLQSLLDILNAPGDLDVKSLKKQLKVVRQDLLVSIDYLNIHKRSVEYSFYNSFNHEVERFIGGKKTNPGAERRYNRSLAKYNKLCESGKNPTWKVVPPTLVDLDLARSNMVKIANSLVNSINNDISIDSEI